MYIKPADSHSLLRPEYVESLFYFWRITGNETYRDWGWSAWEAIEQYAKVESGGYSSVNDVTRAEGGGKRDKMESFFMGETLKYLYLLFSDDEELVGEIGLMMCSIRLISLCLIQRRMRSRGSNIK